MTVRKINNLYCSVCITDLPAYSNGMASNSGTAPYFVNEMISYQCDDTYAPSPPDAALTCTCQENAATDPPTASWSCDPDALATSCAASELFPKNIFTKSKNNNTNESPYELNHIMLTTIKRALVMLLPTTCDPISTLHLALLKEPRTVCLVLYRL